MREVPDIRPASEGGRYEFVDQIVRILTVEGDHPKHTEVCDLADRLDYHGFGSGLDHSREDWLVIRQAAQSISNVCEGLTLGVGSDGTALPDVSHSGLYGCGGDVSPQYLRQVVELLRKRVRSAKQEVRSTWAKHTKIAPIVLAAVAVHREAEGLIHSVGLMMQAENRGVDLEGYSPQWVEAMCGELLREREAAAATPPF